MDEGRIFTAMGAGGWSFGAPRVALKDLPVPTTDAEAEEWIEATLKLPEKALLRLYTLLYNRGLRVNKP